MAERLPLFATASRGTEPLLAAELETLGAKKVRQGRGGVNFMANLDEAMRLIVHSRLAMRMLYPLGEFDAPGAEGLYEAASAVAWEEWLTTASTFAVEATLTNSEHTHSGFVALKIKDGIVDRMRKIKGERPDVDTQSPDVQVVAHLNKTKLSLSLDLCGDALFKRGYRIKTTPAPLKETLAAAVLMASGYTGEEPLADPMCGSGTIVIEAGYIATNRPPGLKRHFGVERWPSLGEKATALLLDVKAEAQSHVRPAPYPIVARDRDEEALDAATRNVAAAGLAAVVRVESADAVHDAPPADLPRGLICTNPPYGDRLSAGGQKGMKTFYFQLGEGMNQWAGWRMAFLSGNAAFESAFHHRPIKRTPLFNGPIECTLIEYGPQPVKNPESTS
jgi:putative N6-adenine-specific DNA methylase